MGTPRPPVAGFATNLSRQKAFYSDGSIRTERQPLRIRPLMRKYEISYLSSTGAVEESVHIAPAKPLFEDAFAALGRGALVATEYGPLAVEDLVPGMLVQTVNGLAPIQWVGSTTLQAGAQEIAPGDAPRLTRLSSDALGLGRPAPDLVLGPRARLLYRSPRCREMLGTTTAFAPARAFIDGISVIEVAPASAVHLYHIGLFGQQTIFANGVEIESYHPGMHIESMMDAETHELFMSLFPHIDSPEQFGPMDTPRLTAFELDTIRNG